MKSVGEYFESIKENISKEEEIFQNAQKSKDQLLSNKPRNLLAKNFKEFIKSYDLIPHTLNFLLYPDIMKEGISNILKNTILYDKKDKIYQSSEHQDFKFFHWFDWGKKTLNLYDIPNSQIEIVELDIAFKIPSFSRSVLMPSMQKIFLVGGEEPEYYPRKEIFMFDLVNWKKDYNGKHALVSFAKMPQKKFDCILAQMGGWLYILGGKGSGGEILGSCHRFNPERKEFQEMTNLKYARYAGSAASVGQRLFVFGGRKAQSNQVVNEIEMWDAQLNKWCEISLKASTKHLYIPVEVCGAIQIQDKKILIFGGSDEFIKDLNQTVEFDVEEMTFHKKQDLRYAQVFVQAPYLFGNCVYALGNEYYMKRRNLHKYNLETDTWSIIF